MISPRLSQTSCNCKRKPLRHLRASLLSRDEFKMIKRPRSVKWLLALGLFYYILVPAWAEWGLDVNGLDTEELRETFGTEDRKKVPAHIAFVPSVDHHTNGSIQHLWLNISELHKLDSSILEFLSFVPSHSKFVSPEISVVQRFGNRSSLEIAGREWISNCHFESNSKEVLAALSNCDGSLKGVIMKPSGTFVIHPAPKRHQQLYKHDSNLDLSDYGLHVIYKRDTGENSASGEFCEMDGFPENVSYSEEEAEYFEDAYVISDWEDVRSRLSKRDEMTIELALFADEDLWKKFSTRYGSYAGTKLQDFVITIFNNIQLMYQSPTISPKISFKIVHYEVFKQQPPSLHSSQHSAGNAQKYLDVFCKYQAALRNRDRWDHAFLMSGLNLHKGYRSNSISGIARLHGMCDNDNTCTLTEGLDFTSVFIGTHELGHSVGMRHDEPYCDSSHIMSSSLGPGKVTWSTCSIKDYKKFMERLDRRGKNCLKYAKQSEVVSRDQTLPGQKYSADQQCEMMHGYGYKQVTPTQDYPEKLCHMMWCGLNGFGRIITSHPALEGTFCGHNLWCMEGKCVQWTSAPHAQPTRVDGGWSGWSGVTCSYCSCAPFPSGVGLLASRRTCTNPAPQNGGSECPGSDVRGIICSRDCGRRSDTIKAYAGRICENHRVSRNEAELTGKGAQLLKYASRACKVFCVIKNDDGRRNYRFLGDLLPDGTECGWNSYCVGGTCQAVSCNSRAITGETQDCPASESEMCSILESAAAPPSTPSNWQQWSTWASCSVTCGSGYKSRDRTCQRGTDGSTCPGSSSETTNCNVGFCSWLDWSACTESCNGGTKRRIRYCPGGGCDGLAEQTIACNVKSCIVWSTWSLWTACSQTCGVGTRKRSRNCSGMDCSKYRGGSEENVEQCTPKFCPWQAWSPCSVTCGSGSKERRRSCPGGGCYADSWDTVGGDKEVRNCDTGYCYEYAWADWTSWTACSATCGAGQVARYRSCRDQKNKESKNNECKGEAVEAKICMDKDTCGIWSAWSLWSECSKTCGGYGERSRNRDCNGVPDCKGENTEKESCGNQSPCAPPGGIWSSWSPWGACSVRCGAGTSRRHRDCVEEPCSGVATEQQLCNEECGAWSQWSAWSLCSLSCGGYGERNRARNCIGGSGCRGPAAEPEKCGNPSPCPDFLLRDQQAAAELRKAVWSSWSVWGSCSASCGMGIQTRHRDCVKGFCSESPIDSQVCKSLRECGGVWTPWGSWSQCTKSCGSGGQFRERTCPLGQCGGHDGARQFAPCNVHSCSLHNPQQLEQLRSTSPDTSDVPEKMVLGNWGSWGIWSGCSRSCGEGTRSRARNCYTGLNCLGKGLEEEPCDYGLCAQWGGWGQWSGCSASCGGGLEKRVRNCYGLGDCAENGVESKVCAGEPCSDFRQ